MEGLWWNRECHSMNAIVVVVDVMMVVVVDHSCDDCDHFFLHPHHRYKPPFHLLHHSIARNFLFLVEVSAVV